MAATREILVASKTKKKEHYCIIISMCEVKKMAANL